MYLNEKILSFLPPLPPFIFSISFSPFFHSPFLPFCFYLNIKFFLLFCLLLYHLFASKSSCTNASSWVCKSSHYYGQEVNTWELWWKFRKGEDSVWKEHLLSVLCVGKYFIYAYSVHIYGEDLGRELLTYSLARNTSGSDLCLQWHFFHWRGSRDL